MESQNYLLLIQEKDIEKYVQLKIKLKLNYKHKMSIYKSANQYIDWSILKKLKLISKKKLKLESIINYLNVEIVNYFKKLTS